MKLYKLTEIASTQWPHLNLQQLQSMIDIYKPLPEYRDAWIQKCIEKQKIDFHDDTRNKQTETDPFFGLPDWVQYIATDGSGHKIGYENKPIKYHYCKWWVDPLNGNVTHISEYENPANGWENSLIERKR